MIVAAAYLIVTFHRNYVEQPVWQFIRTVHLRPMFSGVLATLAVLRLHSALPQLVGFNDVRYLIPVKMAIDLAVFIPIYMILLIALRQVTAIDWKNFLSLVSFGFEFLRHPFRERVKIYR
jgi:hypothetical protein